MANKAQADTQKKLIDLDGNVGFLVSDAHRLVTAVVDQEMSSLGLTRSQLRVVLFLSRADGCTQVELAEKLEIGKVSMGGLLDRLEEKGLLERKSNPQDRRAKRIFLKPKIKTLYQPMQDIGEGLMDKLLAGLDSQERQQFSSYLQLLKKNCRDILKVDE